MIRFARSAFFFSTIGVLTVISFDVAAYFLAPTSYNSFFVGYRTASIISSKLAARSGYYVSDPDTGFEIAANRQAVEEVDGIPYNVWSNSIGCFDVPIEEKHFSDYIYLAGDSFAWGYARFEDKFGTILEMRTGLEVAKCGVTHSGQWHQLIKLKKILRRITISPQLIIVAYCYNDSANDYAFPHTTVLDNILIDDSHGR